MAAGSTLPTYSDRILLFVGGLGRDPGSTADAVASSIAAAANDVTDGHVQLRRERVPAAPAGLRTVGSIEIQGDGPDSAVLMDVLEVLYLDRVEELDKDKDGRQGVPPSILRTFLYTLYAVGIYLKALRSPEKGGRTKAQLFIGFAFVGLIALAFLFTVLAALAWLLSATGLEGAVPAWLTEATPIVAVTGGVISAASYLKFRASVMRSAQRLRQILRYMNEANEASGVYSAVATAVDSLRDGGYRGEVHILAYSFGGIVTLDRLTAANGGEIAERLASRVASLVTVGCPYDFMKLYWPKYFEARRSLTHAVPWTNIFSAADIFSSNFIANKPDTVEGSGVGPGGLTPHSVRLYPNESLTLMRMLLQFGFRRHDQYWKADRPSGWACVLDRWGLLPPDGAAVGADLPPETDDESADRVLRSLIPALNGQ